MTIGCSTDLIPLNNELIQNKSGETVCMDQIREQENFHKLIQVWSDDFGDRYVDSLLNSYSTPTKQDTVSSIVEYLYYRSDLIRRYYPKQYNNVHEAVNLERLPKRTKSDEPVNMNFIIDDVYIPMNSPFGNNCNHIYMLFYNTARNVRFKIYACQSYCEKYIIIDYIDYVARSGCDAEGKIYLTNLRSAFLQQLTVPTEYTSNLHATFLRHFSNLGHWGIYKYYDFQGFYNLILSQKHEMLDLHMRMYHPTEEGSESGDNGNNGGGNPEGVIFLKENKNIN